MIEYEKAIRACSDASSMESDACKNLIDLKLLFWGKYSSELSKLSKLKKQHIKDMERAEKARNW